MRARIAQLIDHLRTGFWFLPSSMMFFATCLALFLLWVDQKVDPGINASLPWAYSGGAEGARSLLSTIAGSMITAASVTFSLASVALSIASQQYGSRVLRNFMRDRITQVLLGTFVSTFVYSVLIVRSIRGSDFSGGFVPAISVTGAIALSLISLILLVYFVHHVSTSIQASHIVRVIAEDLNKAIPELYPVSPRGNTTKGSALEDLHKLPMHTISKDQSGYIQSVDLEALIDIAARNDAVIEVVIKPGDHFICQSSIAIIWGDRQIATEDLRRASTAFLIGGERTPLQDIRFQFQQLTDVIVRALSPGINDPFTAINGIDALASAACQLARRPRVADARNDPSGKLRIIVSTPSIGEIMRDTVGHIALYAAGNPFVMAPLRGVLQLIEPNLTGQDERAMLSELHEDLNRLEARAARN
ncbi:DUF2254 domain-containing protein [soil metagenome]